MIDPGQIQAAVTSLTLVGKALTWLRGKEIDAEALGQVTEALSKLGEAQGTIFELQGELIRLQGENQELHSRLKERDEWDDRKRHYRLEDTPGGAKVYVFYHDVPGERRMMDIQSEGFDTPASHYACPNCFEERRISVLQDRQNFAGLARCPHCESDYKVRPTQQGPRLGRRF